MPGTESMTSSDWMLLALSAMGHDSQRKVGEAFVQRLLEKGDVHPAAAILLGLGEQNDAIEVYVSRKYFMEAVLLTCLVFPNDWQRQSYLVRQWGESAVKHGAPELAVRCFSCTSIQSSGPWFSPRAQGEVFAAQEQQHQQQRQAMISDFSPMSPPSAGTQGRMTTKNSALKLITSFGDKGAPMPLSQGLSVGGAGITPIAESALSPGGDWLRPSTRSRTNPSSARTATPGAYGRRRQPLTEETPTTAFAGPTSRVGLGQSWQSSSAHPSTRAQDQMPAVFPHSRSLSHGQGNLSATLSSAIYSPINSEREAQHENRSHTLPSPAHGVFDTLRETSRNRNGSRDRKPGNLHLRVYETVTTDEPDPSTTSSNAPDARRQRASSPSDLFAPTYPDTPQTGSSLKSAKGRSIDKYINSLEEANYSARRQRTESRSRAESRDARARDRAGRQDSANPRETSGVRYIRPAKKSPASPVPMTPDQVGQNARNDNFDDERYYGVASPVESARSRGRMAGRSENAELKGTSRTSRQPNSPDVRPKARSRSKQTSRVASRATSRQRSPGGGAVPDAFGRAERTQERLKPPSPTSPVPMTAEGAKQQGETARLAEPIAGVEPLRPRLRSSSRRLEDREDNLGRGASPTPRIYRTRSASIRSTQDYTVPQEAQQSDVHASGNSDERSSTDQPRHDRAMSRKELAARELEERRLSLARRPSVPIIPYPSGPPPVRPRMSPRSATDLGNSPISYLPPVSSLSARGITRSQSTDPDIMIRHALRTTGTSTASTPIGLPATPRAMRHPRYMTANPNEREAIPVVPELPDFAEDAQVFDSLSDETDKLAPLLPSTVFVLRNLPARSASAPPQPNADFQPFSVSSNQAGPEADSPTLSNRRSSFGVKRSRKVSSSEVQSALNEPQTSTSVITASIDAALNNESEVVIIGNADPAPPLLPELQHLATPPPPPPPPSVLPFGTSPSPSARSSSVGVINIGMDETVRPGHTPDMNLGPTPTGSPSMHRRGRGSLTENITGSSIGSKLRNVRERMRSTSGSRNKSPPMESFTPSPYETVLPPINFPMRRESVSRHQARLSSEQIAPISEERASPPLLRAASVPYERTEQVARSNKLFGVAYRTPKEIRANMPPEQLQMGVTPSSHGAT